MADAIAAWKQKRSGEFAALAPVAKIWSRSARRSPCAARPHRHA